MPPPLRPSARDNSGTLSTAEFLSLPELQQNPLVERVIAIFDADGDGEIDFEEFIKGIALFSVRGDRETKLRCKWREKKLTGPFAFSSLCCPVAFKIYDVDKDNYISNGELFQVLKLMVGNNLKDPQLQQVRGAWDAQDDKGPLQTPSYVCHVPTSRPD